MNNAKQHAIQPRPWQSPQITTLSISRNTEQLQPPDPGEQS